MTLDTQNGKADPQAGKAPEPQAGPDDGQVPESVSELKEALAAARREAAKNRKSARDAETKLAADEAARKAKDEDEAKKRGEYEKLHQSEKTRADQLAAQLERVVFDGVLERAVQKLRPLPEMAEDILRVFDRDGLVMKDGKIEGLEDRLAAFKKAKPRYFESDAPARGLSGYSPSNGASGSSVVTDRLRREAEERGLDPQFWADLQAKRQKEKAGART